MANVFAAVNRQASKEHICPTMPLEHLIFSTEISLEYSSEYGHIFINAPEELQETPHAIYAIMLMSTQLMRHVEPTVRQAKAVFRSRDTCDKDPSMKSPKTIRDLLFHT